MWRIKDGVAVYGTTKETLISIGGLNKPSVNAAGNIDGLTFDQVNGYDRLTIADSLTGTNQVSLDGAGYTFKFEGENNGVNVKVINADKVSGTASNDSLTAENVSVESDVTFEIYGGGGSDTIVAKNISVASGGDFNVYGDDWNGTDDGNDTILIESVTSDGNFCVYGFGGDDSIAFKNVSLSGDFSFSGDYDVSGTNDGNDNILLYNVLYFTSEHDRVNSGGGGNDSITLKNVTISSAKNSGSLTYDGGNDDDSISFENISVSGTVIEVKGGNGKDSISLKNASFENDAIFKIYGDDNADLISVENVSLSGSQLKVEGGDGNDNISIDSVTGGTFYVDYDGEVLHEFTVDGGSGDDSISVKNISGAYIYSGGGSDTLVFGGNVNASIGDFSTDDKISLASAVDSVRFDAATRTLTLGTNVITLNEGDRRNFDDVTVYNGTSETTLNELLGGNIWRTKDDVATYGTTKETLISIGGLVNHSVDAAGNIAGLTFDEYEGNDRLTIADSLTGANQVSVNSATDYIFKFAGDAVNVKVINAKEVDGTDKNDSITAENISLASDGELTVKGGAGDDSVAVKNVSVASGGNFYADGGAGDDSISVENVSVESGGKFTASGNSGDGADSINVKNVSASGDFYVYGDAGDDSISVENVSVENGGYFDVDGDAGDDSISVENVSVESSGNFEVYGDAGDDSISVENVSVASGGNFYVDGGASDDSINVENVSVESGGTFKIDGGEGADLISLSNVSGAQIDGGGGVDTLTFGRNVTATIKDFNADDKISLSSAINPYYVTFNNGVLKLGTNTLTLDGVTSADNFNQVTVYKADGTTTNLAALLAENGWEIEGGVATYGKTNETLLSIGGLVNASVDAAGNIDGLTVDKDEYYDDRLTIADSLTGDKQVSVDSENYTFRFEGENNGVNVKVINAKRVDGTASNDSITAENVSINGEFNVFGDLGDDSIVVKNVSIASGGNFKVEGGFDADSIAVKNVSVTSVYFQVEGGDCDDSIAVSNVSVRGKFNVYGDNFQSDANDGNDNILIDSVTIGGNFYVYGDNSNGTGNGNDNISVKNVSVASNFNVYGNDGKDNISIDSVTSGDFTVSGGLGADSISVKNVSVASGKDFKIYGDFEYSYEDDGNDLISVESISGAQIYSGGGSDTLVFGGNVKASISDFSTDDKISLTSAIETATFNSSTRTLTLGTNVITLDKGDRRNFDDVIVYNGTSETTLNELLSGDIWRIKDGVAIHSVKGAGTISVGGLQNIEVDADGQIDGLNLTDKELTIADNLTGTKQVSVDGAEYTFKFDGGAVNVKVANAKEVFGTSDADTLSLENATISDDFEISGNDGKDTVSVVNVSVTGELTVHGGGDNDTISVDGVTQTSGNFEVAGGEGSDSISVKNVSVANGAFGVYGEDGNDNILIDSVSGGNFEFAGGEGADSISVKNVSVSYLNIFGDNLNGTGAGNDNISIDSVTIAGYFAVQGGEGSDTLVVKNVSVASGTFNIYGDNYNGTGAGNDIISVENISGAQIFSGNGSDTLVFGGNVKASIGDFSTSDIISLTSAIDSATFDASTKTLTLGTNIITLNGGDRRNFDDVIVYNGSSQTNLNDLLGGNIWRIKDGVATYGTTTKTFISIAGLVNASVDAAGNIAGLTLADKKLTISDSLTGTSQVSVDGSGYTFNFDGGAVNAKVINAAGFTGTPYNDSLAIEDSAVASGGIFGFNSGGGNDTVSVKNVSVNNEYSQLIIYGDIGDDSISFENVSVVSGGEFNVYGDNGADSISVANVSVANGAFEVYGGEGSDNIAVESVSVVGGYFDVYGGDSADSISVANVSVSGGGFNIYGDNWDGKGNAGKDTISVEKVSVASGGTFKVDSGADNDSITVSNASVSGNVEIIGDAGKDTISIENISVASGGTFKVDGGADNDSITIKDSNGVSIISGAGVDTLTFGGNVTATIGDFNAGDIISLTSAIDSATFDAVTKTLTLGTNVITLNEGDRRNFDSVVVYNGTNETTLNDLLGDMWRIDKGVATYGKNNETLLTISGLQNIAVDASGNIDGLTIDNKELTIADSLTGTSQVTVDGADYTFNFEGGAVNVKVTNAEKVFGTTNNDTISIDATINVDGGKGNDSITATNATVSSNVEIKLFLWLCLYIAGEIKEFSSFWRTYNCKF